MSARSSRTRVTKPGSGPIDRIPTGRDTGSERRLEHRDLRSAALKGQHAGALAQERDGRLIVEQISRPLVGDVDQEIRLEIEQGSIGLRRQFPSPNTPRATRAAAQRSASTRRPSKPRERHTSCGAFVHAVKPEPRASQAAARRRACGRCGRYTWVEAGTTPLARQAYGKVRG